MRTLSYSLPALLILIAGSGCRQYLPVGVTPIIEASQKVHGLRNWRDKEVVQADVEIIVGDQTAVDATFTWEANGPRARMDTKDGQTVVFDGKTCWASPPAMATQRSRFHVLTWPWFIMAPFKMTGPGTKLSAHRSCRIDGRSYDTVLQTFSSELGDTPDDWYRLFIDPKTDELAAMAYIVTYGKTTAEANQDPGIILYRNYWDIDGCRIATKYELWHWQPKKGLVGAGPKATGRVRNVRFLSLQDTTFVKPIMAVEVKLPPR